MDRDTFKIVPSQAIPNDASVLPARFVSNIKSDDSVEKMKARLVIGGHRDPMKKLIVHQSQNVQPSSIRLVLVLAAAHKFTVWTSDVRQAYLQSEQVLSRPVFLRDPVKKFDLGENKALQLLKPLYGLSESGDIWYRILDRHHRSDLEMNPLRSDPALYVRMEQGSLIGILGTYVDDMIRAGNTKFWKTPKKTEERFDMEEAKKVPCTSTGFALLENVNGVLWLDQHDYLSKIKVLPEDALYRDLASIKMNLAWLSHSRPDCMFEVSQITQVTEKIFSEGRPETLRGVDKLVKFAKEKIVMLQFFELELKFLKIIGFSDASFARNRDLTFQLGYIVSVGDSKNYVVPLLFKSYKARKVNRSVKGAEMIVFCNMFDAALALRNELKFLHPGSEISLNLLTDSKTMFDVIFKGTRTCEKRLMLDIAGARERFRNRDISDIGLIRSEHNLEDSLTKKMSQSKL